MPTEFHGHWLAVLYRTSIVLLPSANSSTGVALIPRAIAAGVAPGSASVRRHRKPPWDACDRSSASNAYSLILYGQVPMT